jgi:hypothetical protein
VVVVALAGCGGAPAAGTPASGDLASYPPLAGGQPALDAKIVEAADPRVVTLPLTAYVWDDASVRVVNRARILVGDRCMRRYGFDPLPWVPEGQMSLIDWVRYGAWENAALQVGYQSPPSTDNRYPVRFMGADASTVYFGEAAQFRGTPVPDGGCQGQEFTEVFAAARMPFDELHYVADLDRESRARARQDKRVAKLLTGWKSCMSAKGWNYADVMAPFTYWATRRGPDKARPVVSADELRSVQDDLNCKRSSNLLGTWLAAEIAYQHSIVERDAERLREHRRHLDAVLANANTLLARG